MINPLFSMHHALRSSLIPILAIICLAGCRTHDRRIYSTHADKNLHAPNPWAPSTTKAADEATSAMGISPEPVTAPTGVAPTSPALPTP